MIVLFGVLERERNEEKEGDGKKIIFYKYFFNKYCDFCYWIVIIVKL